tara:strand:+ start:814 stop:1281 length:468 start_codon:yes stop_codon:yes gene_type:complete
MMLQKLLTIGGVALGAWYFGKDKVQGYSKALDNISFNLKNTSNLNFDGNGGMQIDVSVEVVNPTTTNLSIPGKMINIKKIDFSTPSGKYLGTAFPNVNNIALPANSKQVIPNIPVQVAISDALSNFMEVIEVFSDTSKLRITTTIEAFGKEFTIN